MSKDYLLYICISITAQKLPSTWLTCYGSFRHHKHPRFRPNIIYDLSLTTVTRAVSIAKTAATLQCNS